MRNRLITFLALTLLLLSLAAPAAAKPLIKSNESYFDIATGMYVLKGNVSVEVKNRTITAGEARVRVATLEVWGTGGITLTQDDISFSGEKVYVHGPEDTAKVTGGVVFKRGNLTITGDEAKFNWRTKRGVITGNVTITKGDETRTAESVTYDVAGNTLE